MTRTELEGSGIFFDSANLEDFDKWLKTHILGGATTNPVIFQNEGILAVSEHIQKMLELAGRYGQARMPISIELPDADWPMDKMIALALDYVEKFPDNAVIKVPMKPDEPDKAFEIVFRLGQEGIRTNATIGLSMGQLVGAAEASRLSLADGDNYISLFWARRDEAKRQIEDGLKTAHAEGKLESQVMLKSEFEKIPDAAATLAMTLKYLETHSLNTRVIVGSIRHVYQIEQAFALGADIVTIPPKHLTAWMYTQRGKETVDEFNQAYRRVEPKIKLLD